MAEQGRRVAVYYSGTERTKAGTFTSDGKFYPQVGKTKYIPKGYEEGQGTSTREGIAISPVPDKKVLSKGSGTTGRSIRNPLTGSGEYDLGQGVKVPITPSTTKAVQEGKGRAEVVLAAAKDNASLGSGGNSGNVGALIVSQEEAKAFQQKGGGYVPYYVSQAKTPQQAATEANILGQTSFTQQGGIFNPRATRSQFETNEAIRLRTQDIAKDVFAFQESPNTFKGAVGTTTYTGTSYELSGDYFNKKFFSQEANFDYAKQARQNFYNLPQGTRTQFQVAQEVTAVTRAGLGTVEFGGSLALTGKEYIRTQGFGVIPKGSSPFALPKWKEFNIKGTESLRQIPTTPSIFVTRNIPIVTSLTGVGLPTRGQDIIPYAREVGQSPEKVINIAGFTYLGAGAAKGIIAGRNIFIAERAAGASRLGALNVVGGEAVSSLSPIQIRQRIFIAETGLKPFKTTQVNKGDILTSTKVGELNGQQLFQAGDKGIVAYTPTRVDYLIYKPKLTGAELTRGSINLGEIQTTTLGKNLFAVKQTELGYDVTGQGTRYVDVAGLRLTQTGRYSLGTQPYLGRYTQEFKSFGQGKQVNPFGKEIDITISKSQFKTVEFTEYSKGQFTKGGKAFGLGITGRPSKATALDIYTKTGRIENNFGSIDFGKSIGKSSSGGRKMVTSFNVRTITPNKNFIDIKTLGTGKQLPSGFKVSRVYTKGEFNYLKDTTKSLQQININRGLSNTLKTTTSPMKTTFETGLKTEMKPITYSAPKTRVEVSTREYTQALPRYSSVSILSDLSSTSLFNPTKTQNAFRVSTSNLTSQKEMIGNINAQQQINVPSFRSPIISPPRGGFTGFNFGRSFVPSTLILPSFALPEFTPSRASAGKQKKRRAPSLYSLAYNIKAPKVSPLEITGITSRAILTGRRR